MPTFRPWLTPALSACLLAALGTLAACGAKDPTSPMHTATPAPSPTAAAPASPAAGLMAAAQAQTPAPWTPLPQRCEESVLIDAGAYTAENNTWGKQGVIGWSQCIGAQALPSAPGQPPAVRAHWSWDWKNQGDNVKAYPEIVFGHKPGFAKSSTAQLPRKISAIGGLSLSYDIVTEREGAGNLSIDMWLTQDPKPTQFAVPPITHEVMIWLEAWGPMYVGGQLSDRVRLNGTLYRVHVGEKFGLGWRYIAFAPNSPMPTAATIDLMPFFDYLRSKGLITANEHLAAINFGNEVISGSGETRVRRLAISVR